MHITDTETLKEERKNEKERNERRKGDRERGKKGEGDKERKGPNTNLQT